MKNYKTLGKYIQLVDERNTIWRICQFLQQLLAKLIKEIRKVNKVKGIVSEGKAFYDILKVLCQKYDFTYPESKLIDFICAVYASAPADFRVPERQNCKKSGFADLLTC